MLNNFQQCFYLESRISGRPKIRRRRDSRWNSLTSWRWRGSCSEQKLLHLPETEVNWTVDKLMRFED